MREAWTLVWSHPGQRTLLQLHYLDGTRVDAAVQRFARTGEGRVEREPGTSIGLWLKVPPQLVRLSVDRVNRLVVVWWVGKALW